MGEAKKTPRQRKESRRARQKERYERMKRLRICAECGQMIPPGNRRTRCEACMEKQKERNRHYYQFRLKAGLCQTCLRPNDRDDRIICSTCANDYKIWRQNNRDRGLCLCGRELVEGFKLCLACRESRRKHNLKKKMERGQNDNRQAEI